MRRLITVLTVFLWVCSVPAYAKLPANIGKLKKEVVQYYASGEYQRDFERAVLPARKYLERRVMHNPTQRRLAIVLDIDETAVSNYALMKGKDFGFLKTDIPLLINRVNSEPLSPILAMTQYANQHGVAVFFVTGREKKYRKRTVKLLKNAGYTQWAHLYLAPNDPKEASIVPFKASVRKALTQQGYDIVLNIGDQDSDLMGGYADQTLKLPNPCYFLA